MFRLRVYIDGVLESGGGNGSAANISAVLQPGITYVGGIPGSDGLTNLTGCLFNVFMKRCVMQRVSNEEGVRNGLMEENANE